MPRSRMVGYISTPPYVLMVWCLIHYSRGSFTVKCIALYYWVDRIKEDEVFGDVKCIGEIKDVGKVSVGKLDRKKPPRSKCEDNLVCSNEF
jgi:hypothetical protein